MGPFELVQLQLILYLLKIVLFPFVIEFFASIMILQRLFNCLLFVTPIVIAFFFPLSFEFLPKVYFALVCFFQLPFVSSIIPISFACELPSRLQPSPAPLDSVHLPFI